MGRGERGELIPNIGVPVTDEPEDVEAEGQEPCSNQVPQSCQVWDGEVVGIQIPAPHPVHHPVSDVEQDEDLGAAREESHQPQLLSPAIPVLPGIPVPSTGISQAGTGIFLLCLYSSSAEQDPSAGDSSVP